MAYPHTTRNDGEEQCTMRLEDFLIVYIDEIYKNIYYSNILYEKHGVFTANYLDYIYELFNEIKKIKPHYNGDHYVYLLKDYKLKVKNSFIRDITLQVFVKNKGTNDSSLNRSREDKLSLTKNLKLTDITITLWLNGHNGEINENDFYTILTHEMQHAYRFWKIISTSHGNDMHGSTKSEGDRYDDNLLSLKLNKDSENKGELNLLHGEVMEALYFLDNTEISSMYAETYEYVRQHNNINTKNYKREIRDCYFNQVLMKCIKVIRNMDRNLSGENSYFYSVAYNSFRERFFKTTVKDDKKGAMLLRQYLIKKYSYAVEMFTKAIQMALCDFNRKVEDDRIESGGVREYVSFNVEKESILEKFNFN